MSGEHDGACSGKPQDTCESLELSIVRIGLETTEIYEERTKYKFAYLSLGVGGRARPRRGRARDRLRQEVPRRRLSTARRPLRHRRRARRRRESPLRRLPRLPRRPTRHQRELTLRFLSHTYFPDQFRARGPRPHAPVSVRGSPRVFFLRLSCLTSRGCASVEPHASEKYAPVFCASSPLEGAPYEPVRLELRPRAPGARRNWKNYLLVYYITYLSQQLLSEVSELESLVKSNQCRSKTQKQTKVSA